MNKNMVLFEIHDTLRSQLNFMCLINNVYVF